MLLFEGEGMQPRLTLIGVKAQSSYLAFPITTLPILVPNEKFIPLLLNVPVVISSPASSCMLTDPRTFKVSRDTN